MPMFSSAGLEPGAMAPRLQFIAWVLDGLADMNFVPASMAVFKRFQSNTVMILSIKFMNNFHYEVYWPSQVHWQKLRLLRRGMGRGETMENLQPDFAAKSLDFLSRN